MLGKAFKSTESDRFEGEGPGDELVFAGFQGIEDPVRPEAVEAELDKAPLRRPSRDRDLRDLVGDN